jgi:hypothetical protein
MEPIAEDKEFRVGSVVVLRSYNVETLSNYMTVGSLCDIEGPWCTWFSDDNEVHEKQFNWNDLLVVMP